MKPFKLVSRLFAVFGVVMMLAVSGWGDSNKPTVSLSCSPSSLNEGNSGTTDITCTVSINVAPNTKDIKLKIKASDGSAKENDNDYIDISDGFKFNENTSDLSQEFTIKINGDTNIESDETFKIKVEDDNTNNDQQFTLPSDQTITILNDDSGSGGGSISTCPGQIITNLNGATASATDSASGDIPRDTIYYYQFTPAVAGTIQVNSSGGSSKNSLFIKDGCSLNLWNKIEDSDTKSSTKITVAAGQLIVIAYENRKSSSKSYSLDFTFVAGGSATTTLDITKTVDSPVAKVGDRVTFTMVGTNNGSSSTKMEIIDTLPTGLTYVSASDSITSRRGDNFNCSRSGQVITCNGDRSFATNDSVTVTVVATVAASGTLTNTATIKGASGTSVIDTATATVTGDTGALSVSNTSLIEGDSGSNPMTFIVSLDTLNPTQDVTVSYATSGGTATGGASCTSGVDYVTKSGTVTIQHNTLSTTFPVMVCGDTTDTVDEMFNVTLSNPVNVSIDGATGTGTISDDDGIIIGSNDMCYDTPTTSGVCLGFASLNCTVTTTIRNKSGNDLSNVQVIKAYNGINLGVVNAIGVDGTQKTTATDTDNGETNADLGLSFGSNFNFSGTYNKGIVYRPDISSPWGTSESHTIYDRTGFGFSLSTMEYVAQYTKSGKTYQSQLASCSINTTNPNTRDFTKTFSTNINGNMQIIGNSVMLSGTSCAPATTNNNNLTLKFANKDTVASTFTRVNSTSANLSLPDGIIADDIEWAGLYWQGRLSSSSSKKTNGQSVLLKTPVMSDYVSIQTDPSKFNWTTSQFEYQGVADITSYVKAGLEGTYWVANVNAEEMSNGFGAWSLVIIYKDKTVSLKNISVYDGFMGIYKGATGTDGIYNNKPVTLSGFLTPTNGDVNSKFLLFGGEGDISLSDSVTMTDNTNTVQSLGSNVFNSSEQIEGVNVTTRNPNCGNTIGVDIDTFNVGSTSATTPIIGNSQTATTVTLTSGGDEYFPGVFAFSTELYEPDVCYTEDVSFGGTLVTSTHIPSSGDTVTYEVGITNKNNEVAKKVAIEKVFDKPREMTYVASSMSIAPIPGTNYAIRTDSTSDDDTAGFYSDTNTTKFLLGVGSSASMGGDIAKNALTKFKYNARIGDQNASENIYLVSYRNDQLGIDFTGLPIRKCTDFNNSFGVAYNSNSGGFNIVDPLLNTGSALNADSTSVKYNLPTQIANRPTNLKIVSFDPVNLDKVKATNAMLAVEIIDLSPYSDSITACNTADSNITSRAWVLMGNSVTNVTNVDFNKDIFGTGFNTGVTEDSFYGNVRKNAAFRISWNVVNDNNDTLKIETLGANSYKLANFPSYGGASCNTAFVPPNGNSGAITAWCGSNGNGGGNSGMTADQLHVCMECVYGLKTNKVCSRDNFTIRPEAFNLQIKDPIGQASVAYDANLSAGYSYRMDLNATNHKNSNSTAGYTIDQNTTMLWSTNGHVVTGCNDVNDQNLSFSFINGAVTNKMYHYDNVGRYELKIRDTNWTEADQATPAHHIGSHWQTGGDCVSGSDIVPVYDSSSTYDANMVGCEISSNHLKNSSPTTVYNDYNLTFRPYTFDISSVQMTKGTGFTTDIKNSNNVWTYMHDLKTSNQMGIRYSGEIKALGQGNVMLNNFVSNCYAEPVKLDANLTFPTVYQYPTGTFWRYRFQEKDTNGNLWRDTNASVLSPGSNSSSPYVAIPSSSFLKDKNGTINLDLTVNFDRNQTTPFNPIMLQMQNLQIKCQISGNCSSLAANKMNYLPDTNLTTNSNVTFIYGRIIPRDIRVFGSTTDAIANGWYEVYNTPTLAGIDLSPSRNDAMWYINKLHNDATDGDATVQNPVIGSTSALGIETYNFGHTNAAPYSAKAHINTESWLWYGQTALTYSDPSGANLNCLTHPCLNISIVPPIGSSGSMKTTTTNSSTTSKASKLTTVSGGLVYDYAPAMQ
ncbi:MAG: Calx-beta domain-containing protein [Sulfurimonas sp.]